MNDADARTEDAKAAGAAVISAARGHTVPIFWTSPSDSEPAGSGVLLQIADEAFVVTAGHVAQEGMEGFKRIGIPGQGNGNISLVGARVWHTEPSQDRHKYDPADIAVLRLTAEHKQALLAAGFRFLRQRDLVQNYQPEPGERIWLHGYPHDTRQKDYSALRIGVEAWTLGMRVSGETQHLLGFEQLTNIAATYPDTRKDSVTSGLGDYHPPHRPEGTSGGGVWAVLPSRALVGSIEPRLVAIQVSWYEEARIAKATRIWVVYQLMTKGWPELASVLALEP
jgi:hypothetical protein